MTLCESRSLAIISLLLTRYAGNGAIELRRRNLSLSKGILQVTQEEMHIRYTHRRISRTDNDSALDQSTLNCVKMISIKTDGELVRKLSIYRTVKFTWTRLRGRWCDRDQVPTRTDHCLQRLRRFEWLFILWVELQSFFVVFKWSSNLLEAVLVNNFSKRIS